MIDKFLLCKEISEKFSFFLNILVVLIFIFLLELIFISLMNRNPKYTKYYEIFKENNQYFAVIYDYGETILGVRCNVITYTNEKYINLYLDNYSTKSKQNLFLENIFFNKVIRYKEGKKLENNSIIYKIITYLRNKITNK